MDTAVTLLVRSAGPAVSVQDLGRTGYLGQGLSAGGAADVLALWEGAALLRRGVQAAIEMAGFGGEFEVTGGSVPVALTGADMAATLDGAKVPRDRSFRMEPGQVLAIGGARRGVYGVLSLGGGLAVPERLGARSAHLRAGLGAPLRAGDRLPVMAGGIAGQGLAVDDRLAGGAIRIVRTAQTELFGEAVLARFVSTRFKRGPRADRMGVQLLAEGERFAAASQLSILSEIITPGDIQMTGEGQPFVLGPECQTTGGYPRLATVVPQDMPRLFQAPPGAELWFEEVSLEAGAADLRAEAARRSALRAAPVRRDPADIADLLSYQLISGVADAGPGDES